MKNKAQRELAEITLLEVIARLNAEKRSKPLDQGFVYDSAIKTTELFAAEIKQGRWAGIDGPVVNHQLTTDRKSTEGCGACSGCADGCRLDRESPPTKDVMCRGDFRLGTACGECIRCLERIERAIYKSTEGASHE